MDNPNTTEVLPQEGVRSSKKKTLVTATIVVLIIGGLFYLGWKNFAILDQFVNGRYTPTPSPTFTATSTSTPTVTPLPTITPTPSPTSLPASAFRVATLSALVPPAPPIAIDAVVLNDDKNVIAEPDFSTLSWYPSSNLGVPTGENSEPFFATFAAGKATWSMDVPLDPGIYELMILDTLYASAGPLTYLVESGTAPLQPLLGTNAITLLSSQGEEPQRMNTWRSIGTYEINTPDNNLSISTSWNVRDERSIVAIDRVLIARYPDSSRDFISQLPAGEQRYIVDDLQAVIDTREIIYNSNVQPAWGDQYQMLVNPGYDSTITWSTLDRVPIGRYEVLIWIPKVTASGDITLQILVDGEALSGEITVNEASLAGNVWGSLGVWETPLIYEKPVRLSVKMTIPSGTPGDVNIDAVAFIKLP